jgi:ferredoxin
METVARVWIDASCIYCDVCAGALPEVFAMGGDRAQVLAEVRVDGVTSANDRERSALNAIGLEYQEGIREAAAGCPVDAIKIAAA